MMYNINILTKCDDENIRAVILAAVCEVISIDSKLVINRMKRGSSNSPVWNTISRQEILNNKF